MILNRGTESLSVIVSVQLKVLMHEILIILSKYLTVSRNLAAPVSLWAVVTTSQRDVTDEIQQRRDGRIINFIIHYSARIATTSEDA